MLLNWDYLQTTTSTEKNGQGHVQVGRIKRAMDGPGYTSWLAYYAAPDVARARLQHIAARWSLGLVSV
jgi:hypothetical protein